MIYKFISEKNKSSFIEIKEENGKAILEIFENNEILSHNTIGKETLYDMIGALHSIQTKIKNNGGQNV